MIITYSVPMCVIYLKQNKAKKESKKRFSVTNRKVKLNLFFFFGFNIIMKRYASKKMHSIDGCQVRRVEKEKETVRHSSQAGRFAEAYVGVSIVGEISVVSSLCV